MTTPTCLRDPLEVTLQVFVELLLLSQFLKVAASFRLLSLFREFTNIQTHNICNNLFKFYGVD